MIHIKHLLFRPAEWRQNLSKSTTTTAKSSSGINTILNSSKLLSPAKTVKVAKPKVKRTVVHPSYFASNKYLPPPKEEPTLVIARHYNDEDSATVAEDIGEEMQTEETDVEEHGYSLQGYSIEILDTYTDREAADHHVTGGRATFGKADILAEASKIVLAPLIVGEEATNHVHVANYITICDSVVPVDDVLVDGTVQVDGVVQADGIVRVDGVVQADGIVRVDGVVQDDGVVQVEDSDVVEGVVHVDGVVQVDGEVDADIKVEENVEVVEVAENVKYGDYYLV